MVELGGSYWLLCDPALVLLVVGSLETRDIFSFSDTLNLGVRLQ